MVDIYLLIEQKGKNIWKRMIGYKDLLGSLRQTTIYCEYMSEKGMFLVRKKIACC
jgi:hypothetical protein